MGNFFVKIYDFFSGRKILMWLILGISALLMAMAAIHIRYVEDITNFFPKQQQEVALIFENLRVKDKLVVMFTSVEDKDIPDTLMACAEEFSTVIGEEAGFSESARLVLGVPDSMIETMTAFVYDHLPLLLSEADYERLDTITRPERIAERMQQNYNNLLSPIGGYVSEFIYRDPLGLGSEALKQLQNQGNNYKYTILDNYLFSPDTKTLLAFIEPFSHKTGNLVDAIESSIEKIQIKHPRVLVQYFGAPAVAAYNARQIKTDSMVTMNIALLIVILFITLAFRNKYSVLLVLPPVFYGALFALAGVYLIQGEISLIAVGAGSIVFGIALSYSIHILAHTNHCPDMRQLIRELAYPLTIGSLTTIGAFIGLLFTNSTLLHDFGLFSAFTLVGTTLFALIFLPHFLAVKQDDKPNSKLLTFIDRLSNVRLDRNKPLVFSILILALVCGLFFGKVGFDSNMMNLNYDPPHLKGAEERLRSFTGDNQEQSVLFIASAKDPNSAAKAYNKLCVLLDSLQTIGKISSYSSIERFVVSDSVQQSRLAKWNSFWSEKKQAQITSLIASEANKLGFEDGSFSEFNALISADYNGLSYDKESPVEQLFADWISPGDALTSFIAQVKLTESSKLEIYNRLSTEEGMIAADRAFFASTLAKSVNDNFYLILYISGLLIFFALLLSYGRIELTLVSFLPMFVSWIIILGVMSLFGIEFNIVTVILSTFIFGIGDDFSIFIMDGLQSEYTNKTQVLAQHKTAIFFSAFAIMIGMGALMFAKHPAMYSLGLISFIGIIVVVLVTYTIQPFIFRLLISSQTAKGGFPYTFAGLVNTIYAFGFFMLGCLMIQLMILISYLIPIKSTFRKSLIHGIASKLSYLFIKAMITVKMVNINDVGETFKKPAVVIANHQSFIDILVLLSLHPKFIMVTNGWVWQSPFFGRIVRYLDFYHTGNGYEALAESLKQKVAQGYSVIVFPEGTRSSDCRIKRFHKGAFYLAELLQLDIVPILLYGNGLISAKRQPFYIKKGKIASKILPRIPFYSSQYGMSYQERSKKIARYFKQEYQKLYEQYNRTHNAYFRDALIKNYIYKGPVLEWYMRVKLKMEKWYDEYDRILPREGYIVDLGCGYGAMSYMLLLLSNRRRITGVDYDQQKIAVANTCFAKNDQIAFLHGDIRTFDIPAADAYVISDVLHYFNHQAQELVIQRCIERLNGGGKLVIRDGDITLKERHAKTEQSEKWSTQIVKFNKVDGPLCFLSRTQLISIAERNRMNIEIREGDSKTSNTLFILTQKREDYE